MSERPKVNCNFIGSQSRLIRCAEIVLEKGHQIGAVITSDTAVASWVTEHGLQHITPDGDLAAKLSQQPCDHLFSIDNPYVVPKSVLALPRKRAINFHDAPLPKYAGVNASNWALIDGKTDHGVTWHVMTEQLNGGDILKQSTFPLRPNETALTLNGLCYDKSIELFAVLISELAEAREKTIPQDLEQRTYCPRWKRPRAACAIDWSLSADQIDALFRGLDYGSYPNPLGIPKLFLGDQVSIVRRMKVLDEKPQVVPGTITRITDQTICVASGTNEVRLQEFLSLDGEPLVPRELLKSCGLHEGDVLPELDSQRAAAVTSLHSELAKHEDFWVDQLADLKVVNVPFIKPDSTISKEPPELKANFCTPAPFLELPTAAENAGDLVLAALMLYFCRVGSTTSYDVAFRGTCLKDQLADNEIFFASHVPLRCDVDLAQPFMEFCDSTRRQIEATCSRGTYARDIAFRNPKLHAAPHHSSPKLPVAVQRPKSLSDDQPGTGSDLVVVIPDNGKELVWWYRAEAVDIADLERMQEQFKVLLNDIVARKDCSIGELSITPEHERRQLLERWNDTGVDYPRDACTHELFEAQVERTPDAVAVVSGDATLTYRELNARANQLAHYLRAQGVAPDVLVGLLIEPSLEMIVAVLGVLKAGGAYVPLDPAYPPDRLAFMLADTNAPLLITQAALTERLGSYGGCVLQLDEGWSEISEQPTSNPLASVQAGHLAYVIYTSGSTGKPKGVMIEHSALCNHMMWMQRQFPLTTTDRVLQKTPFSFDASVWEFYAPLLVGGQLVMARPGAHADANYLVHAIQDQRITILQLVPTTLDVLLDHSEFDACQSLRRVFCGGEALSPKLARQFQRRMDASLHNLYGPTESTIDSTFSTYSLDDGPTTVSIGRPVDNVQVYVLDAHTQLVPIGVSGELYIGGAQLARGYLNRPELTEEKFVEDPFANQPAARLYKTGDLVRWNSDGKLEFLGRIDDQVKMHGLRIELGEIEAVLNESPDIAASAVTLQEGRQGNKRLVAFCVSATDGDLNASELKNELRNRLPDYMVPTAILPLVRLPRLPNGKVDRKALPELDQSRPELEATFVAPRTEFEQRIAEIWEEMFGIENIGIRDDFLALGGHSLLATRIIAQIQGEFHSQLGLQDFLDLPTIEKLAHYILEQLVNQFDDATLSSVLVEICD